MSLYSGNKAVEASSGSKWEPGPFKFRVVSASVADWGVLYELKTWTADGKEGPTIKDALRIHSTSDAMRKEVDRRLTTMLGKSELENETQLLSKTGWVILRKGPKYLEPMPFGGYYTADKKSATGNTESILERIQEAMEYDWTKDKYAVDKAERTGTKPETSTSPEDSDSMPF